MGLLDRFRRAQPRHLAPAGTQTAASSAMNASVTSPVAQPGFAVIDVETTGLSANSHRVLELAIVRTDTTGRVLDEWVSRFNPDGPVGATHIHGIRNADVATAPRFAQMLTQVSHRLAGAAIAGHNVQFDLAFLRAEYTRAGWALPQLPAACTLAASWDHLPRLDRRRLVDCCAATSIHHTGAHSALGDARATATLLASYLDHRSGKPPGPELTELPQLGLSTVWPTAPGGVRARVDIPTRVQRSMTAPQPSAVPLVQLLAKFRLADALDEGAPEGSLPYLQLLAEVLEDGVLDDGEKAALRDLADIYSLADADVAAAHRGLLLSLAHVALYDGKVSRTEKAELVTTAGLLDVRETLVTDVLDAAEAARHARLSADLQPLPDSWTYGEPLRVGDKVVFTGCDDALRNQLEQRAESLGVRVTSKVSRRTAMLVTDGSFSGGKAADATALGTRCVHPDQFDVLLRHLQPANRPTVAAVPRQRTATQPVPWPATGSLPTPDDIGLPMSSAGDVPPTVIRTWARNNGFTVGDRGRLPSEVTEAYRRAHAQAFTS